VEGGDDAVSTAIGWFLGVSVVLCRIASLGAVFSGVRYRRRYRVIHQLRPSWIKDFFNTAPFARLEWLFTRQQNHELENLWHVAVTLFALMLFLFVETFVIFALAFAILPTPQQHRSVGLA